MEYEPLSVSKGGVGMGQWCDGLSYIVIKQDGEQRTGMLSYEMLFLENAKIFSEEKQK